MGSAHIGSVNRLVIDYRRWPFRYQTPLFDQSRIVGDRRFGAKSSQRNQRGDKDDKKNDIRIG